MEHYAEIGVLAKRAWLGVDLNSLDTRATEVISTAAANVRLFENEQTHGTLEVLRWRFDEGVIEATPVHLESIDPGRHFDRLCACAFGAPINTSLPPSLAGKRMRGQDENIKLSPISVLSFLG